MLSIKRSEVPSYLRKSDFYLSLNDEDDEEIDIPNNCFKTDTAVNDVDDLRHLLSTLRFWGEPRVLWEVYNAIRVEVVADSVVNDFSAEFPYLTIVCEIRDTKPISVKDTLLLVIRDGNLELLVFLLNLHREDTKILTNQGFQLSCAAARGGHLPLLQFLHSQHCSWDATATTAAARGGHFECLKYLHENGCEWSKVGLVDAAVTGNSLRSVKYVVEQNCPVYAHSFNTATLADNEAICAYIHSLNISYPINFSLYLASYQAHRCLKFAITHGFTVNERELYRVRSVQFLQIMHETGHVWTVNACASLASHGDVNLLRYAHEIGCPWDEQTCHNGAIHHRESNAHTGYLSCLQYAHEQGCPWNARTASAALLHKNIAAIKYLHYQDFPFPVNFATLAVDRTTVEMLRCVHQLGCVLEEEAMRCAVSRGKLDCVKYLVEHDCPVPMDACQQAGELPSQSILQYLHSMQHKLDRACAAYIAARLRGTYVPTATATVEWMDTDIPVVVVPTPKNMCNIQ